MMDVMDIGFGIGMGIGARLYRLGHVDSVEQSSLRSFSVLPQQHVQVTPQSNGSICIDCGVVGLKGITGGACFRWR